MGPTPHLGFLICTGTRFPTLAVRCTQTPEVALCPGGTETERPRGLRSEPCLVREEELWLNPWADQTLGPGAVACPGSCPALALAGSGPGTASPKGLQ